MVADCADSVAWNQCGIHNPGITYRQKKREARAAEKPVDRRVGKETRMTPEETLFALARELGYKVIKIKPIEKMLPCECGHTRRETWFDAATKETILVCKKCGTAVRGQTEADARRNWNEVMKSATN